MKAIVKKDLPRIFNKGDEFKIISLIDVENGYEVTYQENNSPVYSKYVFGSKEKAREYLEFI